jgi:hypothetical protein
MVSRRILLAFLCLGLLASAQDAQQARNNLESAQLGSLSENAYRNAFFGFSFKIPLSWVDRTETMREGSEPGKSLVMLGVFQHPPEVTAETTNSAAVFAAESTSSYPKLKTALDYFGPIEEVTKGKGFELYNDPYTFTVGTKELLRADFSKEVGKVPFFQSTLVMIEKGFIVSFTFLGTDNDEVEGLIEKLSFSGKRSPRK